MFIKVASGLAVVALLLMLMYFYDVQDVLLNFLQRVKQAGWQGQVVFMLIVAFTGIGLIPSVVLTLGAGLLYGMLLGSLMIVVAETFGAIIAFLLGRYVLTDAAARLLQKRTRLKALLAHRACSRWRFVALTRMIPFLPFKLMNYLYGLTPLNLKNYALGTFLGLWPITLINVYLGSMAGDLLSLQSAGRPQSVEYWIVYLVGFMLLLALVIYMARRAMREIEELDPSQSTGEN